MKITVILSGEPVECELLKSNSKSVIVKTPDGKTIKRHKIKHMPSQE